MSLWLATLLTTPQPGSGLDFPAASDPVGRWVVGVALILTPIVPYLIARFQGQKPVSNVVGAPPAVGDISTPKLDVGAEYLKQYIDTLKNHIEQDALKYEARLSACEAKNIQLSEQVREAVIAAAVSKTQVESLTADVVELRADNVELRAENRALRGRLNG